VIRFAIGRRQLTMTDCDEQSVIGSLQSAHIADFVLCGGPRSWLLARGRSTSYACPAQDGYRVLAGERRLR